MIDMGSLKKFKVGKTRKEFDSYVVNTDKTRAKRIKKELKGKLGNDVKVRIVKAPGKGYDVYTWPPEEKFSSISKRRKRRK